MAPRLLTILVFFAALLGAAAAFAECETGGLSGTSLETDATQGGRGVGGTGRSDSKGKGTGTGGTGLGDDSSGEGGTGSGGTGILGIVTGFGSVCVNGTKVEYDAETHINVDGQAATKEDLAIGQLARITTRAGQPKYAQEIHVQHVLVGPIERVESNQRSLWVMGQRVDLQVRGQAGATGGSRQDRQNELTAGTRVAVSGFQRIDGSVSATRVEARPAARMSMVTAIVSETQAGEIRLGGLRARLAASEGRGTKSLVGQRVRVAGEWDPNTRAFEGARIERASSVEPGVRRVSIQGFVSGHDTPRTIRVGDVSVGAEGIEVPASALEVDSRVRVEGVVERSGHVRAERILVEDTGRRGRSARDAQDAVEDREDRENRTDREDREDREDRSGRTERSGRSERPERPERGERSGRSDRSGR